MTQIQLSNVSKTYRVYERPEGKFSFFKSAVKRSPRNIRALDNISFSIEEGELLGYIGPNGAGKSTTVKIMSGILTPEEGECVIMGRTPWKERIDHVAQIGVVFGQRSQLFWDLPVEDSFSLLRDIYNVPQGDYKTRRDSLIPALNLESFLKTPVRQLSLGQRMRCELAASLLHGPKILFLDEPTIGLDAVSKLNLRSFLKEENRKNNVTVILTTHDMDDIEALCRRVMVIGHGRLLFDGDLSHLKKRYGSIRKMKLSGPGMQEIKAVFESRAGVLDVQAPVQAMEESLEISFNSSVTSPQELLKLLPENFPLADLVVEERDIDEIIADMYKELDLQ